MGSAPLTGIAPAYAAVPLDRAAGLRTDSRWVARALADPRAEVVPMWRDRCLVGEAPAALRRGGAAARRVIAAGPEPVLLGLDKEAGVFASDLSELSEAAALRLSGASRAVPVRDLFGELSGGDSDVLAYARGLLHWHTQQRFCGRCGSATVSGHGGTIRTCGNGSCGKHHFPRIEPAVIVLVEAPDSPSRCLMARHHGAPEGAYSLLAGFVEVGEGMEHTVAREVHEEAGVTLAEVTYLGSQGWPFPAGLMVGFRARAASASVRTDERELLDARWFTRSEVRERRASPRGLGPADSIGSRMLAEWLAE